ncbi:SH3 domain-containing protein [Saccharothrix syringae]|uniref:SH3 domain-containing protein n=1 Tax=Saccharothrix syringae TaxID=103733 RepID=A0A5Q0HC11_SACSY|nr:SH3 domain-containing protein [Saccharothrix syringae]QFZ23350.1 SH3 domain-containing protein [Saccharothrix syringae]
MLGVPVRGLVVLGVLATAGLMYVANGGARLGAEESGTGPCRVTVIADILNVRSGPADTQPIVSTMRRDAVVPAERRVENGFRMLDEGRWVKDEFVLPTSDSDCS